MLMAAILASGSLQTQEKSDDFPVLKGPYLGQTPPGMKPEIFAPGIITTELHDDAAPVFLSDGKEVFFRIIGLVNHKIVGKIFHMKEQNGRWTFPQIASFCSFKPDMGIEGKMAASPDGSKLFFSSTRPTSAKDTSEDLNIWYVKRTVDGWSAPINIGEPINTEKNENISSIGPDDTLYFDIESVEGEYSSESVYSKFVNNKYTAPKKMDEILTRLPYAGDCIISPDGSFVIISAMSERDIPDLLVSFLKLDGSWCKPINLGKNINSEKVDKFAGFSPDGKYLFFVSRRDNLQKNKKRVWNLNYFQGTLKSGGADIYWVDAKIINGLKPEELK